MDEQKDWKLRLEAYLKASQEPRRRAEVALEELQRRDPKHRYEIILYTGRGTRPGFDLMGAVVYGIVYQIVRYRRFLWFLLDEKWHGPIFRDGPPSPERS